MSSLLRLEGPVVRADSVADQLIASNVVFTRNTTRNRAHITKKRCQRTIGGKQHGRQLGRRIKVLVLGPSRTSSAFTPAVVGVFIQLFFTMKFIHVGPANEVLHSTQHTNQRPRRATLDTLHLAVARQSDTTLMASLTSGANCSAAVGRRSVAYAAPCQYPWTCNYNTGLTEKLISE